MNEPPETRSTKHSESSSAAPQRTGCRARVLVVDDDEALLGLLEGELMDAGFDVDKASDGIDALASMYATCPDWVLVDLSMPRMTGVELIAQVCTESSFREVTVVAMSGHEGLLRRAKEAGASTAFVKPLNMEGVIAVLRDEGRIARAFAQGGFMP